MSSGPPTPYRELTAVGLIVGVLFGVVMTASFVYVALRLGFTIPGSTVAAILGFAVLRGVLRRSSIIENNINQTVASGVNSSSAGVAFTLPALFILAHDDPTLRGFDILPILLAAMGGAFLGVAFIVPLRKQIIELERLRFPSGIAVASLLRSPGAAMRQAVLLGAGFAVAAAFHAAIQLEWMPEELDATTALGLPPYVPVALAVTFAMLGAGLLSGRGGLPFVFGGVLSWWVLSPLAVAFGWVPSAAQLSLPADVAATAYPLWLRDAVIYGQMLRPLGIGVLIGGALSGVVASFPAVRAAFRSLTAATRSGAGSDEIDPRVLYVGVGLSFVVLLAASLLSGQGITLARALLISVVGTAWIGVAGLVVAQATGMTDIIPVSGMSLVGVTLMYFLSGGNVIASIILGVAVSMGLGQVGDMMTDLKAGHLIGAMPRRQQAAQLFLSWIGVPVAVGAVYLLWRGFDAPGFGVPGADLPAPQGNALAAVIRGLRDGAAPVDKYLAGTAIGLGLGAFPVGGTGVLVGLAMYLPFSVTVTYAVGCLASMALRAWHGARWIGETLVPVAAGFIIGEALTNLTAVILKLALGEA
ncbi:MAG: OPT/YSL family transporter [Sandaracinaceae bacterium]